MSYLKVSINNKTNSFTIQTNAKLKHWNPHSQCQKLQTCWNKKYRFDPNNTSVDDAIEIQSCLTKIQTAYHALPEKKNLWTSFRDFCLIPSTRSKIDAICKEILEQKIVLPISASDAVGESSGINDPTSSSSTQQQSSSTANQTWTSAAHGHATSRLQTTNRAAHTQMPQRRDKGKEKVDRNEDKNANDEPTSITDSSQPSSSTPSKLQADQTKQHHLHSLLGIPPELIKYSFQFLSIEDLIILREVGNHTIKDLVDYYILLEARARFYVGSDNFQEAVAHLKYFSKIMYVLPEELTFLHKEIIPGFKKIKSTFHLFPDSLKIDQNDQEFDANKFLNELTQNIKLDGIAYILKQIISEFMHSSSSHLLQYLIILTKHIIHNNPNDTVSDSYDFKNLFASAVSQRANLAVELLLLLGIADEDIDVKLSSIEMAQLLIKYKRDLNPKTGSPSLNPDDIPLTRFLLENGMNPNLTDKSGETVLHQFIYQVDRMRSYGKYVSLILDPTIPCPLDINAQDSHGRTALFKSTKTHGCSQKTMQFLLEHGANPHLGDQYGNLPIHNLHKSTYFNMKSIKILLHFGADINALNNKGETPFYLFIKKEVKNINNQLSHGNKNSVTNGWTLLQRAYFLLKHGADLTIVPHNSKQLCLAHIAINCNNLKLLQLFIENGASLTRKSKGKTPLQRAKELRHKEIVKYLQIKEKEQLTGKSN